MSTVCPALVLFGQGDEDAAAFQEAVFAYGHLGHLLWCHFQETDLKKQGLFTCTSKTHAICHSALLSRYLNPRLVWCFIGEDMMSTVQQLTQACTKGNTPLSGPMKSLEHWRIAMHLEWQSWKKAVLRSLHPLPHRYLVQFLASGDASETSKLYWRSWGYSFLMRNIL